MAKYRNSLRWLKELVPNLLLKDLTRLAYQQLLNAFAKSHEHQTTMNFHHQLKSAILDALDDGLLPRDPTRKAIIKGKIYNSTVNNRLEKYCKQAHIPVISVHGLRHTHASLLLFAGVSIASVARRLGHSSMTTTQKTYLHIIQELESKDMNLVMRSMSASG